ncbi:rhamnosyltransferase WsaF family glycosyltransferase [Methylobacterium sp. Leaf94]|uniref:rhamnosyltransferase WsaF family glycosyltransferase n=1 Tax=Methylobacterium sp. Leaf94 TaxID=1736250 RepID=UPI0009E6FF8E
MSLFHKSKSFRRHVELIRRSVLFDKRFYRKSYGIGPYTSAEKHFYDIGWKTGFRPSPYFDTQFYLRTYQDVQEIGINPLIHYLLDGGSELRRPTDDFDPRAFYAAHPTLDLTAKTPAEHCVALYGSYRWRRRAEAPPATSAAAEATFKSVFDADFYRSHHPDVVDANIDPLQHFIHFGQFEYRDPSSAFESFYYRRTFAALESRGRSLIDTYHAQVQQIVPQTASAESIAVDLRDRATDTTGPALRLCVHAHCFYPELIKELIPGFHNLPPDARIVITAVSAADAQFIARAMHRHAVRQPTEVRVVPNRGRDIGPFLVGCQDVWRACDVVLHLHTKVSTHVSWGEEWRHYLFDQTLGSKALVDWVLERFAADPSLGCLYPRNFHRIREYVNVEQNSAAIDAFLAVLGLPAAAGAQPDYPAGSMAWYRTAGLATLADALTTLDRFEAEADQVDLTFAHALERIMPLVVRASGYAVRNYVTERRDRLIPVSGLPDRESSRCPPATLWPRDTPRIARRPPLPVAPVSRLYNPDALDVHWIVPSFAQGGAGGHMTIFRLVEWLERFGHHQTIWFQNAAHFDNQAQAKRLLQTWYRPIGSRVHVRFLPDDVRQISADVLIATDCWSAYPAAQVQNVKERFYLIQDFEPSFHAAGDLNLIAEATYGFGFAHLCAGTWLLDRMRARGVWARAWELCADHTVYSEGAPRPAVAARPIRIAFYAREHTPRRAVALGFAAFEALSERGFPFEVALFGQADLVLQYAFPHVQHGILTPKELAALYRSCDLGVVFSTTNYSLIPLEMMACGLPVIEIDTESTRAIFKNDEVTFAGPMPYVIADAIERLASDPDRQALQRARGLAFTQATSWERSARALEAALFERLGETGFTPVSVATLPAPASLKGTRATVFIPTYDAGPAFDSVLDALSEQVCDFPYDVLVVDSGSTDGTAERVRARGGKFRVETIDKAAFQHGRTRNFGIARSEGDYVALLTQDACPKDARWLSALIGGFARGPRVAGVIGRHEAYPDHDPFTRRDLQEMFDRLALLPDMIDRETGLPSFFYPGGQSWAMTLQFYSDNNSAMSREAWKILPYPDVEWGEDQIWAAEALRLGFQKAYVDEAVVYHSHAFDMAQQRAVSAVEGRFWAEHFGIDLHPDTEGAIRGMDARDRAFAEEQGIPERVLQLRLDQNRATVKGRSV